MTNLAPKACVIGWPISHSRSPLIHGYWLKQYGLAGSYERKPVEPEKLAAFCETLRKGDFAGCNVTLPHKQSALAFIDHPDARVTRIGALNTVWKKAGSLHATSTDGPGYLANLHSTQPDFIVENGTAVVLGAGGSARAIIDEMIRQGVPKIIVFNRTKARAEELARLFGPQVQVSDAIDLPNHFASAQLLINTTSAGISDGEKLIVPWQALNKNAMVSDISYVPLVTPFLEDAKGRGHRIVTGLGMLLHQAVFGFEKWFGVKPTVTPELYDLIARDIDPDYQP
jgi:shikimate dehydrogenase